jgi:hypothetical protein
MTDEEMAKEYVDKLYAEKVSKEDYDKDGHILYQSEDISDAFLAGLKAGRPKWHKVADGDLPKENCENILLYNKDHFCVTHSYSLGYYENGVFYNDCEMEEDTIAWCEIPQYEEE